MKPKRAAAISMVSTGVPARSCCGGVNPGRYRPPRRPPGRSPAHCPPMQTSRPPEGERDVENGIQLAADSGMRVASGAEPDGTPFFRLAA